MKLALLLTLFLAQTSFVTRAGRQEIVTVKDGDAFMLVQEENDVETRITQVVYRDVFAVDYPVRIVPAGVWVVYVTARRHRPFEQRVECRCLTPKTYKVDRLVILFDGQPAAMRVVQLLVERLGKRSAGQPGLVLKYHLLDSGKMLPFETERRPDERRP